MRHLDLFSGIGGFALAAKWMGWETVQFVEIDSFCQKVLQKNFPNVPIHGDIKTFNGTPLMGTIDILTGGFPCQPFSTAGKRKGNEDDRYLWPEMLRVIGEIQPSFIVGENVYGLVNWSGGLVFEEVQASLEDKGYQVAPVILPACAKGAPHRRDRIWFIANAISGSERPSRKGDRTKSHRSGNNSQPKERGEQTEQHIGRNYVLWNAPNTKSQGFKSRGLCIRNETAIAEPDYDIGKHDWGSFPTQSHICGRDDGIPNRVDRIKSLGNAVVPQVVYEIFKAIELCSKNAQDVK